MPSPTPASSPEGVIATACIFGFLPIVFVSLRFYARGVARISFGDDDYLIIPALILNIGLAITTLCGVQYGQYGGHQALGPNKEIIHYDGLTTYEKTRYAIQIFGILVVGLAKLSLLTLYRRIFITRKFRYFVDSTIVIVVMWTVAYTITSIFQCTPISVLWDRFEYEYGSSCIQPLPFYYSTTITDVILDTAMLVLPIPMILGLQMSTKQKISVLAILLLGVMVIGASIARLVIFRQVGVALTTDYSNFADITHLTTPTFYWTGIECGLSIICCCLPTLRPLTGSLLIQRLTRSRSRISGPSAHERIDDDSHALTAIKNKNNTRTYAGFKSEPDEFDGGRIWVQHEFNISTASRA